MGSQISLQCALFGYAVNLVDSDVDQLERAVETQKALLQRRVQKEKLAPAEMEAALDLLNVMPDVQNAAGPADFVIEAIVERLDVKQAVFDELVDVCGSETILATNSSTIGISQIVTNVEPQRRCLNMHFFHPAMVMQLVEVMRGPGTSDSTVQTTVELVRRIGKEPVLINQEVYGLLVNRILGAIKREAFWLAENGFATPQDIDRAVKLGLNHPMGPFELSDFSGLDVFYYASLQRYHETGDEQYKPSALLEEKVKAGHWGRKTGKGFYDYDTTD